LSRCCRLQSGTRGRASQTETPRGVFNGAECGFEVFDDFIGLMFQRRIGVTRGRASQTSRPRGASLMTFSRVIEHRRIALSPAPVELFQRIQTAPLHLSICHTSGSLVTCVFSIVSTRLRQRSTDQLACQPTEQTSEGFISLKKVVIWYFVLSVPVENYVTNKV